MASKKITCLDCGQVNRVPDDKLSAGPKCGTCGAKLIPGKAVEVDFATLQKAARNDDLPLVVDFWAPWCGPCRMMAPKFAEAATLLEPEMRLAKLDTEQSPGVGAQYGIRSIPTLILFKGGEAVERITAVFEASRTLIWNGPLGAFEIEPFDTGTNAAAKKAAELSRAGSLISVAGGGDTVAALNQAHAADDFTYISTAGGAFLEWMEGKTLPGVAALEASAA